MSDDSRQELLARIKTSKNTNKQVLAMMVDVMNIDDNYVPIKSNLLTAINLCAPNGKVQNAFVDLLHESELRGDSHKDTIMMLVSALYDGLAFGNWITRQ